MISNKEMVENNNSNPDNESFEQNHVPQNVPFGEFVQSLIHNADDDIKPDFLPHRKRDDIDIDKFRLDMSIPLKKPLFLLASNGVQFSMLKSLMCITGQAGNGKTNTIDLFIAAILKGKIGNLTYEQGETIPTPKVLYIDTEQEEYYTKLVAHKVCAMADWEREQNHEQLHIFNLREEPDTETRWNIIIKAIETIRPTVAIVDGLLDVVDNQNEIDQCSPIVNECLAIASKYNLSFWTVIHQNPNGGNKMSGNLGSIAERKASDVFGTAKEKDENTDKSTFKVEQLKARGQEVEKWHFRVEWNEEKHLAIPTPILTPTKATEQKKDPEQVKAERMQELADKYGALNIGQDGIGITELRRLVGDKYKDPKKSRTNKECNEMISYGMMSYNEINKHYYYHGIPSTPQPTQTCLQFDGDQGTSAPEPDGNGLPF